MHSFFFGSSKKKLYGSIMAAKSHALGALICNSWGPEYQASHRFLRVLSNKLAQEGISAMRFDYYGSGDSYGSTRELNIESMIEDTLNAEEEFRETWQPVDICLIGYRLGALPALHAGVELNLPVVLVEPVTDCKQWFINLIDTAKGDVEAGDACMELSGYCMSAEMKEALMADRTALIGQIHREHVTAVIASSDLAKDSGLSEKCLVFPGEPTWLLDADGAWAGAIPAKLIESVVKIVHNCVQS